ncbi:MAG: hypothetical protein V2J11_08700, partial [Desulfofustis sp.]|nr:hypothetical protein [Desulfofustis sp.]
MKEELEKLYTSLKKRGLTDEQEARIRAEMAFEGSHGLAADGADGRAEDSTFADRPFYAYSDLFDLQGICAMRSTVNVSIRSIDKLLERDKQREEDGFPRKIRIGRIVKPGSGGKEK